MRRPGLRPALTCSSVLCEGKDDCWALRSAIAKLAPALDLNARSISLVDTGGVGNLPDYADIAKQLGTPWCAVTDEDKPQGGPLNAVTERVRQRVDANADAAQLASLADETPEGRSIVVLAKAKHELRERDMTALDAASYPSPPRPE